MLFVTKNKFSVRVTKIASRIGLMNSQFIFLFLTYLLVNELRPYYQKDVNQITFNNTTL